MFLNLELVVFRQVCRMNNLCTNRDTFHSSVSKQIGDYRICQYRVVVKAPLLSLKRKKD